MRIQLRLLRVALALLAGIHAAHAQPALGIIRTNNQSLLYWPSNATGYVLQSATNLALPDWTNAADAIPATYGSQTAMTVTNASSARFFRLFQNVTPPGGMALIPAGSFIIGDTLDGISFAIPTNVHVSAFFMDTNLVRYDQW